MADKKFPKSDIPIRKSSEFLPQVFKTEANDKFLQGTLDPLVQPGVLDKLVGYIGRRYGKTYNGNDIYLDTDQTLRSRYQLEPGVISRKDDKVESFYDYLDLKNILKFFGSTEENDNYTTSQDHYSWNPPIDWDKFVNFREYYWVPDGPPPIVISGQSQNVESTYRVKLGTNNNSYIFYPDGLTNNPTLTLYRGQTYKFIVNTPGEGFTIRSSYDLGSLRYNPDLAYPRGTLVLFGDKLWRSLRDIAQGDGSTIDESSQDWEYVEPASTAASIDYNIGVTNNGASTGTIVFDIPYDSPDVLYYQSQTNPDRLGRFVIADIDTNTFVDVEKEIIGKTTYVSGNGITFSNGMVIRFSGNVAPEKYATEDSWVVEGVGRSISLVKFNDLVISAGLNPTVPEVLFDDAGFDTEPFDDAQFYPARKDYVTINRSSKDLNPWSRYNRWFHRSVLEYAYRLSGSDFDSDESNRAKRPIVEFLPNIQLFNHGAVAKLAVDYIDNFTTDVFSIIEGSRGYLVDGEPLFQGARILVISDTDSLANNKIYEVNFINHNGVRQISLKETADSAPNVGECVLVKRGSRNQRSMWHFNGTSWLRSQEKTDVNQSPLFDVYDSAGLSFSDSIAYPVSTFVGSEILSYKKGNSIVDSELGFSLSYLNIGNVGDILFEFDWEIDRFFYQVSNNTLSKEIKTGYYKITSDDSYENCWIKTNKRFLQPIIDSKSISESSDTVIFNTVDWEEFDLDSNSVLQVFVNGIISKNYTRKLETFKFNTVLDKNSIVSLKLFSNVLPNEGYYEIPVGLEKNPLNDELETFTLGTASDHVRSALEFNNELTGPIIGSNNLRDIGDYHQYGSRIVKHSGTAPLAISLLASKEFNIIKSLQYAKKSYSDFKNTFIDLLTKAPLDASSVEIVDYVLTEISKSKTANSAFADSDMLGSGAYTEIVYTVEDTGIKTFTLSEKFDLETLSRKAVYVYKNDSQLIYGKDYNFNSTFGFLNLLIDLVEGDVVVVREYVSTATNYIPPTPTKLGLYKKYLPEKILDDTYVVPREVIRGHDGSVVSCFGDYRDDAILELELRIYNNIKKQYDSSIFDIDNNIQSYYGVGDFSKYKIDLILIKEYYRWLSDTNIDYTSNSFFDTENSFTYTYSTMLDRARTTDLPGYWRGVYQWFYDTDHPHSRPWEMLGFSEQPVWWEDEYGPAPYTRGNLILWEDLRDGIIRQGERKGTYDRYKRPSLLDHIPVDNDGKLLSPLDSNLAVNFTLANSRGDFKPGDISPVEYVWRSSSEYPFAIVIAMCLLKPLDYITKNFNNNDTVLNILGQTVDKETNYFSRLSDITVPAAGTTLTSGLIVYLADYLKSKGLSATLISDFLSNMDVAISSRLSGFVDQDNQKYVLDSKNPNSSSGSVFIPQENYDIIFNVSAPIRTVSYSGLIIEKVERGWKISGYDTIDPVFYYYSAIPTSTDVNITVGGVSESFLDWNEDKFYGNGVVIRYNNVYYRTTKSFTSGNVFTTDNLQKLSALPITGGVTALRRTKFNTFRIRTLVYGSILSSIQDVVDFIFGYDYYLKSQGFVFEGYDSETAAPTDWNTSIKEFMFWTKHNWEVGSILIVSPSANGVQLSNSTGVVDNLLNSFYDYSVLKGDGTPLEQNFINVFRGFQEFKISPTNTNEGIYFFKGFLVLKEHVTIFDDRTVFNDVIYDKPTGYRQERIKSRGFRTTDWDGDYTSPGFIFDNVNIEAWQPYVDYRLGDIISYQNQYFTSKVNQSGTLEFNYDNWEKTDSVPTKQLVPNFDYRINQIEDYYDLDSEGVGSSQRELAKRFVGYQTRKYLEDISEDSIIQYKLYQGFIREKGTSNAITKIFDKTSKVSDDSIVLNEEWAFKSGDFGGVDQLKQIEFLVDKNKLEVNPQPTIIVENESSGAVTDQYLRIAKKDFTISFVPFTTNPTSQTFYKDLNRSAGFVKKDHVNFIVKDFDELITLNIFDFYENDHVWVTFFNNTWTVLRFNQNLLLNVVDVQESGDTVTITFNTPHSYNAGDIVGFKTVGNLEGFYKVDSVDFRTIVVTKRTTARVEYDPSSITFIYDFTDAKFASYESLDQESVALLKSNSKLWVENNGNNKWEVIEKSNQYLGKSIIQYGISSPSEAGSKVLYSEQLSQTIVSLPRSNYVLSYSESSDQLSLKNIIAPPEEFQAFTGFSFGKAMALSPDNRFLIVGAPNSSGVRSKFRGVYDPSGQYFVSEIVTYGGRLWQATEDIAGDGSSIDVYSERWEPATLVEALSIGRGAGYELQGAIFVYEWADQQWNYRKTILSPFVDQDENFGFDISIGKTGTNYFMAVSAPGALQGRGRVYLFNFDGTNWSHLIDNNYAGRYSSSTFYPVGSIVYYDNKLWQAQTEITGDDSTIAIDGVSSDWLQIDPVSTQNSLPLNVFLDDDGSTIASGILTDESLSELTKQGDRFGYSVAMNRDASILTISAPYSDGQFFNKFRGDWKSVEEYTEGDVVRYENNYYRLLNPSMDVVDSSLIYTNIGSDPSDSEAWINVGDSTDRAKGKVFVYQRDQYNRYVLKQTVAADNLDSINDTGTVESISVGDLFGYDLDIDYTGTTLVISSPEADVNFINQGAVFVFETSGFADVQYRLVQKLVSHEKTTNSFFGASVAISPATEQIVVGAKTAPAKLYATFDNVSTAFDQGTTVFTESNGYPGQVYVFQRKSTRYLLAEKLEADLQTFESFGYSVDASSSIIVVGSPNYGSNKEGLVRLFRKNANTSTWNTIAEELALVDIELINSVSLYDNESFEKVADLDYIDPFKNKILSEAEQELDFKTVYDPAIYSVGNDSVVVDQNQPWREKQVGRVWWDLSTAKWINYEQSDISYRSGNWGVQAHGSSIDIFEWVETPLLPSEWSVLADTTEGLAAGISGLPLYPNDTVYSVKQIYNVETGELSQTTYYYWVKNKKTIPSVSFRRKSISDIATLISNPQSSGITYLSFIDADKFLLHNFDSVITNNLTYLNIEYKKSRGELKPIHREYVLLTEGQVDSLPPDSLERKWIDSLVGFDLKGNSVPDQNLAPKQKYGISFRPRQSMFVNREKILKIVIDSINTTLESQPFADIIDFKTLTLTDPVPAEGLNEYDVAVDNFIDLEQVGTARIRRAVLTPVIVDGEIESIDIIDTGFGYRVAPQIEIEGTGTGARAEVTIDSQGRINSATVLIKGKKYSSALVKIREFSVLVNSDETSNGYWSIYSFDQQRTSFYRSKTQGFNTSNYWEYIDWWKPGYGSSSRIVKELINFYLEPTIILEDGDLIRIKEYGTGGWAVLEKVPAGTGSFNDNYNLVGRQNGTIRLKDGLYNSKTEPLGFDNVGAFDAVLYDLQPSAELRNILKAVKEDIFKDDLSVEWNKLFFLSVNYAFSEQEYIDWAFKTSFLNAVHNAGILERKLNYKNDNLDSYRMYIEEVKPYRTTIREYTSRYTNIDNTQTAVTDFDSPPAYSSIDGKIIPIGISSDKADLYPWKSWVDNASYSVVDIQIADAGADYITPPIVRIEGNGTGASAIAYVVNGRVSKIKVTDVGYGYTKTPIVYLVGGNGNSQNIAKAVAILGDTKIRSFDLSIKFDRINKTGSYQNYSQSQVFVATGSTAVFELNYAPTRDKSKIRIIKNNQLVLSSEYAISLYLSSTDTYSLLKGKILFNEPPQTGDVIEITYDKNDDLLDSIDRINKYYNPTSGMKGNEISQLMTGIDFGGVQVQGTTFDVTGGWDALPWFTEGWDSVESNSDFYVVCDGSTNFITLPFTPADGQLITIYLKRNQEDPYLGLSIDSTFERQIDNLQFSQEIESKNKFIRIDDPYFNLYDGSTIQPNGRTQAPASAVMPTFVGDGSTNVVQFADPVTDVSYIRTEPGDTLIFRTIDSDGSVVINDVNLLDTNLSGGSLAALGSAYVTATGTSAEEIVVDGNEFVNPDSVPATEENVPGQVLESVSIKVFNTTKSGVAPLQNKVYLADGITKSYRIDLEIFESSSVMVYVDKIKQSTEYTIDLINNLIEFEIAPAAGSIIEIISVGIGGLQLLDYQEFIADGETNFFLTKAKYEQTSAVSVSVNGESVDIGYVNSSEFIDDQDLVLLQFGVPPEQNTVIKVVVLGSAEDVDSTGLSLIRVNKQQLIYDGSTRRFDLDTFVNLTRGSSQASALVTVNDRQLVGVDTTYQIFDGTNNNITIGVDPEEAIGNITSGNIRVYVNNQLKRFVIDYVYDGNQNLITIPAANLTLGDEIKIEVDLRAEFYFEDNDLIILDSVSMFENDIIEITWFGEYPSMDIISDEFAGGKESFRLSRTPLDISYVWVYLNGIRLSQDVDYILDLSRSSVILTSDTVSSDIIKIFQFGTSIKRDPIAYEIFKDMLNVYHYKRYSKDSAIKLAKDLNYYDQEIEVTDGSILYNPIPTRNLPGIIIINNERIEYLEKDGNFLRKLRRGCQGTAIAEIHSKDEFVINVSATETVPYNEDQLRTDFVSDGSSLIIGPLDFVPRKSDTAFYRVQDSDGNYLSIPVEYGRCDEIEVFVSGQRLRKVSLDVYDEQLGSSSPAADKKLEAEFSVDGVNPYIRLTEPVKAGTRITIIRKTGKVWYERGEISASKGKTFVDNTTPMIKFIKEKTTQLPE